MQLFSTMRFQPIMKLSSPFTARVFAWEAFYDSPHNDQLFAAADPELEISCIYSALIIADSQPLLKRTPLFLNISPAALMVTTELVYHRLLRVVNQPVIIELTEHGPPVPTDELLSRIDWLQQQGLRFAIDDVCMGTRSWYTLINPDYLKVDTTIVIDCESSYMRQAMLASLVKKARGIKSHLIVEGIENRAQLLTCYQLGILYGQGYYWSKPLSCGLAPELLAEV